MFSESFHIAIGDGVQTPRVEADLTLPDPGTTTLRLSGRVQSAGKAPVPITPPTLTAVVAPVTTTTYWLIEVNLNTGVAQVLTSTSAMPAVGAGNYCLLSQVVTAGANAASRTDHPRSIGG